jgi:ubiquinol-cytochrome c reductase cytochrome b subunit
MEGSSNPFTIENRDVNVFYLPLYPYFFIKDLIGVVIFSIVISYFIFFNPNVLGHSDNYIEANSMVTPEHIVPEWYFLPFYAILRSIPNKEIGIIAMGLSLVIFFFIPIINFFIDNNFFFKKNNVVFGYSNVYLSSLDIQVFRFFFITFFG